MSVKEPKGEVAAKPESMLGYVRKLGSVLRDHKDFRLIVIFRLLVGMAGVVTPFFVVYATKGVGLSTSVAGTFLAAQLVGGLAASVGLGYLLERVGSRLTTILEGVLTAAAPALALVFALTLSSRPAAFLVGYTLVNVLVGASMNSFPLGHMTYLLECAPEAERTTYAALTNTVSGVLIIMPLLTGWLLEATSYSFVFALAFLIGAPSILVSIRLKEPRLTRTAPPAQVGESPASAAEPTP
jgi:predicted MFS family arabinose efflux permease